MKTAGPKKKASGHSQDGFREHIINDAQLRFVSVLKLGNNEMFKGTSWMLKLLVPYVIYWFRTAGRAAISNTASKYSAIVN